LKYSIMINGVTKLLLMKADVLNVFKTIKICTHYKLENGTITDNIPYEIVHEKITPVYREVPGWHCPLDKITSGSMPVQLNNYVVLLEKELGVPIMLISTGPDRTQTIFRD
jgi:adenylosuccinate synthase